MVFASDVVEFPTIVFGRTRRLSWNRLSVNRPPHLVRANRKEELFLAAVFSRAANQPGITIDRVLLILQQDSHPLFE